MLTGDGGSRLLDSPEEDLVGGSIWLGSLSHRSVRRGGPSCWSEVFASGNPRLPAVWGVFSPWSIRRGGLLLMGKRKERRLAAKSAAGRRMKLDLFAEPTGKRFRLRFSADIFGFFFSCYWIMA